MLELAESTSKLHRKVAELKRKWPEVMKLDRQGKIHSFSEKEMIPDKGTIFLSQNKLFLFEQIC